MWEQAKQKDKTHEWIPKTTDLRFQAPVGHRVTLRFYDYFGVYMDASTASEICLHWVQIQTDKTQYHIPGPRFVPSSWFSPKSQYSKQLVEFYLHFCEYRLVL